MFALIVKIVCICLCCLCTLSEAGISTRYWDCCKPTCAWPGKTDLKTHPVYTCHKDGKTKEKDANAKSGCGAVGDAFMCSDQQPWAVNDNLAYGFAAVHLKGEKTSAKTCCACYELTFTSGPVVGKKMIVQATNSGGDLKDDHFDIQIPGGGVGIFNGCTRQYGAPKDGWGQRSGGISSAAQCNQLPKDLQSGCHFRFEWFRNADNPKLNFRRVKCPAQIIAKTGCVRKDEP